MIKKITIGIALSLCTLGAHADGHGFQEAWDAAESKRVEAAAAGVEWRDTGKMLADAKAAYEKGDKDAAKALVKKAHKQSKAALAQGAREKDLWKTRVPK